MNTQKSPSYHILYPLYLVVLPAMLQTWLLNRTFARCWSVNNIVFSDSKIHHVDIFPRTSELAWGSDGLLFATFCTGLLEFDDGFSGVGTFWDKSGIGSARCLSNWKACCDKSIVFRRQSIYASCLYISRHTNDILAFVCLTHRLKLSREQFSRRCLDEVALIHFVVA